MTRLRVANQIANYEERLQGLSRTMQRAGQKTQSFAERLTSSFKKAQNSASASMRRIADYAIGGLLVNAISNAVGKIQELGASFVTSAIQTEQQAMAFVSLTGSAENASS